MHINIEDIIKEGYLMSAKSEFTKAGIEEALKFAYEKAMADGRDIVKEVYHTDCGILLDTYGTEEFEDIINSDYNLLNINNKLEKYKDSHSHYFEALDEIKVNHKIGIVTKRTECHSCAILYVLFKDFTTMEFTTHDMMDDINFLVLFTGKHYNSIEEFVKNNEGYDNED